MDKPILLYHCHKRIYLIYLFILVLKCVRYYLGCKWAHYSSPSVHGKVSAEEKLMYSEREVHLCRLVHHKVNLEDDLVSLW